MSLADIQNLLVPTTAIACLCVGFVLNNLVPGEKIKRYIPLIMGVLGIVFTSWVSEWQMNPDIFLTGFVSGLASTGMYEMFKNFINKPFPAEIGDLEDFTHIPEDIEK